ncbi:MAG: hypothetical protein BWK78_08025 [Thiotrichaceae bacterium IS1]|nr:MAG: hypothetical protein BWK78_08025 [Thiotrichaceae bacterium IS1]
MVGTLYLNYLDKFVAEHLEQRFVIPISTQRLTALKRGKISVWEAFHQPETHWIFITRVNELEGTITSVYLLPEEVFQPFNSVENDYLVPVGEEEIRTDSLTSLMAPLLATLSTNLPDDSSAEFRPVIQLAKFLYLYQQANLSKEMTAALASLTLPEFLSAVAYQ